LLRAEGYYASSSLLPFVVFRNTGVLVDIFDFLPRKRVWVDF
jgi:hypothetical protein